ncbi:MAG TPA: tetratricopeptide repeat protein [bacterium]|nr:tetratricopeptide repeat protein [bacterium]
MRRWGVLLLLFGIGFGCAKQPISDIEKGRRHLRAGEYRAAIVALESDLIRHPENYESQCLIGSAHEKMGDLEAAEKAYAKTIVLNPVNACAFVGFGRVYMLQKRWQDAWNALLRARGVEANETLLQSYPLFRSAAAGGALSVPATALRADGKTPRTVTVAVVVVPATKEKRQSLTVTAASPETEDPFENAFLSALAATAGDRMELCHDRFYGRGLPAALDARYTLSLRPDGTVEVPVRTSEERPIDMKECVKTALATVRFMAQTAP